MKFFEPRIARHLRHVADHEHQRRVSLDVGLLHNPVGCAVDGMVELRIECGARSLVEGMVIVDDRADHQEHEDGKCDDRPLKKPAGPVTFCGLQEQELRQE